MVILASWDSLVAPFDPESKAGGMAWIRKLDPGNLKVKLAGLPAEAVDKLPSQLSGGMRKRLALAQTLILSPDILLMDEPFSALDVQTRQLMENELLALWAVDRKSVLFITHDLEEAIALSDRVVVLSAGPATRPIGDFKVDLPRPRDVSEIRMTPAFAKLHREIWGAMKEEVLDQADWLYIWTSPKPSTVWDKKPLSPVMETCSICTSKSQVKTLTKPRCVFILRCTTPWVAYGLIII